MICDRINVLATLDTNGFDFIGHVYIFLFFNKEFYQSYCDDVYLEDG